jgi:hypothetical protein
MLVAYHWPVYPRLRGTMHASTRSRNKSMWQERISCPPTLPAPTRDRTAIIVKLVEAVEAKPSKRGSYKKRTAVAM